MLQIQDLTEPELMIALASITETAYSIANRLNNIESEEINDYDLYKFRSTDVEWFRRLSFYNYDNYDYSAMVDTCDLITDFRMKHELY